MEIVNGIPCFSCSDVEKAQAGRMSPRQEEAVAALNQPVLPPADEVRGVNQPLTSGPRGTLLNIAI